MSDIEGKTAREQRANAAGRREKREVEWAEHMSQCGQRESSIDKSSSRVHVACGPCSHGSMDADSIRSFSGAQR